MAFSLMQGDSVATPLSSSSGALSLESNSKLSSTYDSVTVNKNEITDERN